MEIMNRSNFALFVAVLIHILLLLLFIVLGSILPPVEKKEQQKERKIKISLKEMPKKYKESGLTKEKIKPTPIAPPMPKGSQLKKIIKKPPIKYEPKPQTQKTQTKINTQPKKPEQKPQPKTKPLPPKQKHINFQEIKKDINITKKQIKEQKEEEIVDPLYALLSQDKSSEEEELQQKKKTSNQSSINQNIKELYGDEFGKLTPGQQQYILDNQEIMRRITQEVLTRVARVNIPRDLNVNRTNVIEFYLHPNGDMSDFKFLSKSGYYILDDTTKETIEYAYSRYPRPKEKTLIRYNVFYNLARY